MDCEESGRMSFFCDVCNDAKEGGGGKVERIFVLKTCWFGFFMN